ncbi:MAG: rhomboid family intramembrane serine protease [Pyrobaculum sp.]
MYIPRATAVVISTSLALYALDQTVGGLYGALSLVPVLASSQLYRLFTHIYIHSDWIHLLFNVLALLLYGPPVERRYGSLHFAMYYTTWGTCGAFIYIIYILANIQTAGPLLYVPNAGASSAVAGVIGAYVALYPPTKLRTTYHRPTTYIRPIDALKAIYQKPNLIQLAQLTLWLSATIWILTEIPQIPATPQDGVNHPAHVGGFLTGLATTPILTSLARRHKNR